MLSLLIIQQKRIHKSLTNLINIIRFFERKIVIFAVIKQKAHFLDKFYYQKLDKRKNTQIKKPILTMDFFRILFFQY
ncbi:hypothetical protein CFY87_06665 [Actinobacillus seminis]|uniref:Uncharacterized protein n=1 Tax=Actinobacillus seminis TaxID=722 RepID=A0ABX4FMN6_9PAST|nr:hypothetical protein CFY87_06665 [Actinobacillus seminis]